jgi:hypothetical protein
MPFPMFCLYCCVTGMKVASISRQSAPREIRKGKFLSRSGSSDELWQLMTPEYTHPPFPQVAQQCV